MEIAALVSGGVDSALALARAVDEFGAGAITAYYLKIWLEDDGAGPGECPWEEDLGFARAVCSQLGVPLEIIPLQRQYHELVIRETIAVLRAGGTPSPDIWCNSRVKFRAFLDAIGDSTDLVVTGHYARSSGDGRLWTAPDPVKDQTYFLSGLSAAQVAKVRFPVGDLPKHRVRSLARERGLAPMERPDSQGICFLGTMRFTDFVDFHLGEEPGPIENAETGEALGEHRGIWYYTIGQRTGLGLAGGPWYVAAKDPERNAVRVVHADAAEQAGFRRITLEQPHWLSGQAPEPAAFAHLRVKLRHGPHRFRGSLALGPAESVLTIDSPDRGIAPGQFAVFYAGDECLGNAVILGAA